MANRPKKFYRGIVPDTLTQVYEVPDDTTSVVTNIVAANNSSSEQGFTISVGGLNLANVKIPANGVLMLDVKQVIEEGDDIKVQAANSGIITAHVCGIEIT